MSDIVWNKKESIERYIKQIHTYYSLAAEVPFKDDHLKQDAIAMNLQRACEQSIDLANHTIRVKKLGLPKNSKESFLLLAQNKIIHNELAVNMGKMVGFRNSLVHEYQKFDINMLIDVIENHLEDLLNFTNLIVKTFSDMLDE